MWKALSTNLKCLPFAFAFSSKLPIQSLSQIYHNALYPPSPSFQLNPQTSNHEIILSLIKAFKMNMFLEEEPKKAIIQMIEGRLKDEQFHQKFMQMLVPFEKTFPEFNELYKRCAIEYLKAVKARNEKPSLEMVFIIQKNIYRSLFVTEDHWGDQLWLENDYSEEQELMSLLMPYILENISEFNNSFVSQSIKICQTLHFDSPAFSGYLLEILHSEDHSVSLKKLNDIINCLLYLSKISCFPYDYYYRNQKLWLENIGYYNQFSTKKANAAILLLNLMIRENLPNIEKTIGKVVEILEEAVPSLDEEQVARLWYLINRPKGGIMPRSIVEKLLEKIESMVSQMQLKEMCLLVRGLAGFQGQMKTCSEVLKVLKRRIPEQRAYEQQIIRILFEKTESSSL